MVLLLCSVMVYARESDELFNKANSAYQSGQIEQALEHYSAITHKGSAVWYNMGNCYYQQQDLARAIVCWQRSLPASSYHDYNDAQNNIANAARLLGIQENNGSFFDFFNAIASAVPIWIMQWLLLIVWFCLWLILFYRYRIRFFYLSFFGIFVAVLFLGLVVYMQWRNEKYQHGVVVATNMVLQVGPNHGYHGVGSMAYGETVDLIEQRPGWYKIAKNEKYGWVDASAIELVESVS